ncbi:MAG: DUF2971 domain-containing protein [Pseudomonadota bacterium]
MGIKRLYHWQRFDADRLEGILRNNSIYFSKPSDFNDPWDCRPFFNVDSLGDPIEARKHIDWAELICRRAGRMNEADIPRMRIQLRDRTTLESKILELTTGFQQDVLDRYRVYCLCPDVTNALMWAHYADSHHGICLEYNVENSVICGALQVQYFDDFPMTRVYSSDLRENLLPVVAKSGVWRYEKEYRLIAQDAANATGHDTLLTTNGLLKLPAGALCAIIVGCQGPFDAVEALARTCNASVQVLKAEKIANRYALNIASTSAAPH